MKKALQQLISKKKYFIFDFDGTLVDLERLNHQSFDEAFSSILNVNVSMDDYKKYISGSGAKGGVRRFLQAKDLDENSYNSIVKHFRSRKNSVIEKDIRSVISVKPGVNAFLTYLKNRKVSIAVGTSSVRRYVKAAIEAFGWDGIFDQIITSEDVVKTKPAPDIFLKVLDSIKGEKESSIIFEDSQNGVDAAKKSGIDYIILHTPGVNNRVIIKEKLVITDYRELMN